MKTLTKIIKPILDACPYTMIGKKCIRVVGAKKNITKKPDKKIIRLQKGMKTGRNLSLIGVFCPFFWFALLTGMSKDFIILNAMHSSIVVAIGLIIVLFNYVAIRYHRSNA